MQLELNTSGIQIRKDSNESIDIESFLKRKPTQNELRISLFLEEPDFSLLFSKPLAIVPILSQLYIVHIFKPNSFKFHFNIIPHLR
jgi:hypothetical protein